MQLKTNVWVNKITSLSEARYCAGMGVQFLGFQPTIVDLKTYQDITGWVLGPAFFLDISEGDKVPANLGDYASDYVLLREDQIPQLPSFIDSKLLIKRVLTDQASAELPPDVEFILAESWATEALQTNASNLIATVTNSHQLASLLSLPLAGILLQGSTEDKPGLMEYDHLSEVLEMLETED
ncbi:MAG: hypothetical protein HOP30_21040 [Cyclobacteriaceae bacterium]|nr:hypothetical protein [Cyclobacteriaceae bacterium]